MDWRTYFSFSGRIRRRDFWVFYWLPPAALSVLWGLQGESPPLIVDLVFVVLILPTLVAGLAGTSKRLHDLGYSLWLWFGLFAGVVFGSVLMAYGPMLMGQVVTGLFAIAMVMVSFMMYFRKGTWGENRYGSDPLASLAEPMGTTATH